MAGERAGPTLTLRAEGGPGIGFGHLGRCLALAQAWRDRGGRATLVAADLPRSWAERYGREGVSVEESWETASHADWVVVDGYEFGVDEEQRARVGGDRLVVIDDRGFSGRRHVADIILDQNLDASASDYEGRSAGSELLLGTRYALLRREFHKVPERRFWPRVARTLLVAPGGSPSPRLSALLRRALVHPSLRAIDVVFLDGTDDVVGAMARADMAIAAAGSTCWELCRSGLPAVLVTVAANQVPIAAAMAAHGAGVFAGHLEDIRAEDLAETVSHVAHSLAVRAEIARIGQELVDGRGACRVVTRLLRDVNA